MAVLQKLRADEIGITLQIAQASALGAISFSSRRSSAKLKAKRAEKRRQMTRAREALKTFRARTATLPPKVELDRRLRKLREKTPKLNLLVDELRQELQRLNELASLTVAEGMNEVAYFCRDVPKAPDPDPELIRLGGLGGL